ncbi:MAG: hypothetical protein RR942_06620 [Romboutsia sp.]
MIKNKLQNGIEKCMVNGLQAKEIQMNNRTFRRLYAYPLQYGYCRLYMGTKVVENNKLDDNEIKLIISKDKYYQKDETVIEINQYLMC